MGSRFIKTMKKIRRWRIAALNNNQGVSDFKDKIMNKKVFAVILAVVAVFMYASVIVKFS